jgi:hypothetical protein
MAGLGYKTFAAGEILTAANLQGYATDQSVMVFESSAARTTALAAPDQGMVSFLEDSGTTWVYYDAYNVSTNPGGAKTAGWYPTFGAVFFATATRSLVSGTSYAVGASGFAYTELTDTLGWHSPSVNPDRIIPNVEGIYRATVSAQFASNATGSRDADLQDTGADLATFYGTGATVRNFSMTGMAYMNGTSSDYFNVANLRQNSGSSLTVIVQVMVEYVRPSIA